MLGRSKSLRLLLGGHKDMHHQETRETAPQPARSPVDGSKIKATVPVTRSEIKVATRESVLLQRPRTSSGPGDRSTMFHKKMIPLQDPNEDPFEPPYPSFARSTADLAATDMLAPHEGIIGIALGSPTMAPQHWNEPHSTELLSSNQSTFTTEVSSPNRRELSRKNSEEAPKPKISRWKSIFKKTAPPPRKENFYQLSKAVQSARTIGQQDNDPLGPRPFDAQEEERQSPTYTFKSDIRQSRKVPKGQAQPAVDTRPRALTLGSTPNSKSKSPLSRFVSSPRAQDLTGNSATVPELTVSGVPQTTTRPIGGRPLLDVEIPTERMERYSVMFSGLLEPHNMSGSSSLLQRRQGNTDKLAPLNTSLVKNDKQPSQDRLQRRATSPSLFSKSLSAQFSLFPSANTSRTPSPRHVTVNRPRPLQRSRTAPATSPSQSTFAQNARASGQPPLKSTPEIDFPDTPSLSTTSSPISERSFDSETEELSIIEARNEPPKERKPLIDDDEPVWEIIRRQSAINTASKAAVLPLEPTSASSQPPTIQEEIPAVGSPRLVRTRSHTVLSSSQPSNDRFGTDIQATIGIARSISVSRGAKLKSPDSVQSPAIGIARSVSVSRGTKLRSPDSVKSLANSLGPGTLFEGKSLTPTLVDLTKRKSQRVQVVQA